MPDNPSCTREFEASLEIERFPCAAPGPDGSKVTFTVADCFGTNVTFNPPFALNPLPVVATAEIVMLAVPTSTKVTNWELEVPTVKLPKFKLVELAVSWEDSEFFGIPAPDNERFNDEFEASLDTDSVPFALPVAFGLKFTLIAID